jgi:hypothetical protein
LFYLFPNILLAVGLGAFLRAGSLLSFTVSCRNRHRERLVAGFVSLVALALIFVIDPFMKFALQTSPTLGLNVPFDRGAWTSPIFPSLRYHMSEDILKRISMGSSRKEDVERLLGRPDLGGGGHVEYILRSNALIGPAYSSLSLDYVNDTVSEVWISDVD